jgi:hypothetical protein
VSEAAARLKRKRGDERVTFEHIADHLVDFAERNPEHADVVADVANFLAAVEDVEHDHSISEHRSEIEPDR